MCKTLYLSIILVCVSYTDHSLFTFRVVLCTWLIISRINYETSISTGTDKFLISLLIRGCCVHLLWDAQDTDTVDRAAADGDRDRCSKFAGNRELLMVRHHPKRPWAKPNPPPSPYVHSPHRHQERAHMHPCLSQTYLDNKHRAQGKRTAINSALLALILPRRVTGHARRAPKSVPTTNHVEHRGSARSKNRSRFQQYANSMKLNLFSPRMGAQR